MSQTQESVTIDEATVELLTRLRTHGAMTRAQIGAATGWARPTVNRRIDDLVAIGLVRPSALPSRTGGRPAQGFAFDPHCAAVLAVDIATTTATVALCDLAGRPVAMRTVDAGAEHDPEDTLGRIDAAADALIAAGQSAIGDDNDGNDDRDIAPAPARLCAVSTAVTTRVETATGNIIQAPVMRHWENHNLRDRFRARYGVPAFVENDANVRALCKAYDLAGAGPSDGSRMIADLMYVHAGMGLGAGVIADGHIMHGAFGAAGDIGHIHVFGEDGAASACRCGNVGCAEASAGGWAVLDALRDAGRPVETLDDVVTLARQGDVETVRLVRRAGRVVGDVVSACVNLLNPSCIVVGGELSHCGELFMSGVRERVWARVQPLAAASLRVESCDDEVRSGVIGLAYAAIDQGLTSVDFLRDFAARRA